MSPTGRAVAFRVSEEDATVGGQLKERAAEVAYQAYKGALIGGAGLLLADKAADVLDLAYRSPLQPRR